MSRHRLGKLCGEFNVELNTLVAFLQSKGFEIINNPNTKITRDQYELIKEEFYEDHLLKEKSKNIIIHYRDNGEIESIEDNTEENSVIKTDQFSDMTKNLLRGITVIGKIELCSISEKKPLRILKKRRFRKTNTDMTPQKVEELTKSSNKFFINLSEFEIWVEKMRLNQIQNPNAITLNIDSVPELNLVDLIFYLRIIKKENKPIICVGNYTITELIEGKPHNAILFSRGVSYIQIPFSKEDLNLSVAKLQVFRPDTDEFSLKPVLKIRIDQLLSEYKHSYANYIGMFLMLLVRLRSFSNKLLGDHYPELYEFTNSISFKMLSFYYGFNKFIKEDRITLDSVDKPGDRSFQNTRILLVDDLADEGWKNILAKIFWKDYHSKNIETVSSNKNGNWKEIIDNKINLHKPHLVLLDLRLNSETGMQKLEDLDGFKLLKFLKEHEIYKGLPVIIFTASTNAEIIKTLLNQGAEAVWTKPGFDDALSSQYIIERYNYLLDVVHKSINKFQISSSKQIKSIHSLLDYTKYRLELFNISDFDTIDLSYISSFTDIFIDTNFLISDYTNEKETVNITENIINIYKLSYILRFSNDSKEPRTILMNQVIDEILKHAKNTNELAARAQWAFSVIMRMFKENIVHTEFNKLAENNFIRKLYYPKESVHADGFIIDEILSYVKIRKKKLAPNVFVDLKDTNVLFITNDNDLAEKLKDLENLTIWNIQTTNNELNKIVL